jgi:hypothetical protein
MNKFKIKYNKLIYILIMILVDSYQALTCNSFPKIFGGSGQYSYLCHIDVFGDYLAMAGDISDLTLAAGLIKGIRYPLIAVTSVAIPDTYYWAKVLSLKGDTTLVGV